MKVSICTGYICSYEFLQMKLSICIIYNMFICISVKVIHVHMSLCRWKYPSALVIYVHMNFCRWNYPSALFIICSYESVQMKVSICTGYICSYEFLQMKLSICIIYNMFICISVKVIHVHMSLCRWNYPYALFIICSYVLV